MTVRPSDDTPMAGHLNGAVQRFGLLSAAAVVDRYVGLVDRAVNAGDPGGERATAATLDADPLVERAARLAEAYLRLLEVTTRLVGSRLETASGSGIELVALPAVVPGAMSEASVWLHNPTEESSQVQVRATAMTSARGDAISDQAPSVSPGIVRLAARESCPLNVRIAIPQSQPPGHYHGLLLLVGSPGEPIVLRVEVRCREDW